MGMMDEKGSEISVLLYLRGRGGGVGGYIVEQIFRGQNGDVMSVQYLVKLVNNPL